MGSVVDAGLRVDLIRGRPAPVAEPVAVAGGDG
jgi:hypothetical protein